jgi:hypothetical protein
MAGAISIAALAVFAVRTFVQRARTRRRSTCGERAIGGIRQTHTGNIVKRRAVTRRALESAYSPYTY